MNNKISFSVLLCLGLCGCVGMNNNAKNDVYETPTVEYIESLDIASVGDAKDSFLNQLAMNYRSYAVYNTRTSGYPDIGELFAQKSVSAFAGETPYPENLDNWNVEDDTERFAIYTAYNDLMTELDEDVFEYQPQLAAEAQAKFDCWISATASGQISTAQECKSRFETSLQTIKDCVSGKAVEKTRVSSENVIGKSSTEKQEVYYPETRHLNAMATSGHEREGIIIINNINVPAQQPSIVLNQDIYDDDSDEETELGDEYVSRDEFINMMMAMRTELAAINKRLDNINSDKTVIKVQQIPLEPKQHIMEEIFEIRFDFNKSVIKPEYEEVIKKLAATTQANKNVRVSVVGHTDTAGSSNYNYALGGRRAEAVQKMLIKYGIPASQIVAVSAGESDLKIKTPNNTPKAANRRVKVVKEVHYTEPQVVKAGEISEEQQISNMEKTPVKESVNINE